MTFNAAIVASGHGGDWRSALELLAAAEGRGLRPDAIARFAAVRACGENWQQAPWMGWVGVRGGRV